MANNFVRIAALFVLVASPLSAERQSLFPLGASRTSAVLDGVPVRRANASPSLFTDRESTSFFAPFPERAPAIASLSGSSPVARLLSLIASAEAGPAGFDAVQYGATIRPSKRPTQMTIGEIYEWIAATPGQPHAIGRYQFIPDTLRRLVESQGLGRDVRFTPSVQNQLALQLLEDAGLRRFQANQLGREAFMRNLARIWAGLPLPSGQSHYEGYAGNKAAITWDTFEAGMVRIFPGSA